MTTIEIPQLPAAVPVRLDPSQTALLVLDLSDKLCGENPDCLGTIPAVAGLLRRAREAGALVVHSLVVSADHTPLPEVAPLAGEATVRTTADKFFRTDLESRLAGKRYAIVVGTQANGAVMYTAFAACARGMTVVVPEDAVSSRVQAGTDLARYQLLYQPGLRNPENKPLENKAVTLSTCDLIEFGGQ